MKRTTCFIIMVTCALYFSPQISFAQRKLVTGTIDPIDIKQQAMEKGNAGQKRAIVETIEKRSKTGSINIFRFDSSILKDSVFLLNIFPNETLRVVKDRIDIKNESDFSLYAYVQGVNSKEGSIVLTYFNGEVSGNLNYKFKNYSIHPLGKGRFAVYEIDFKRFPQDDAHSENTNNSNDINRTREIPHSNRQSTSTTSAGAIYVPITPKCRVRLLVAFTPDAENSIKTGLGYTSMNQFINQAIAETNQSYSNSNVNFRVELVNAHRVAYTESGSYDTDLGRFRTSGDGYMDEIHTYRNLYSADVCLLIFNNGFACGQASDIPANASTAFSVVHYDCVLGNYSFGHEIAHLFGSRHNTEADPTTTPFAYGHGYVYSPGSWRTIMAYNLSGETRLQYYSNPDVSYFGIPMGTASVNNNARVLNETVGTVASFRGTSDVLTIDGSGSINNDESGLATALTTILLRPGFRTAGNSVFYASIKNCIDLTSSSDAPITKADEEANSEADKANAVRNNELSFKVYPNPTSGVISIIATKSNLDNARITVNDQLGKVVYRTLSTSGSSKTVNLSHLPNGVYYVNIINNNETISKKIIIMK